MPFDLTGTYINKNLITIPNEQMCKQKQPQTHYFLEALSLLEIFFFLKKTNNRWKAVKRCLPSTIMWIVSHCKRQSVDGLKIRQLRCVREGNGKRGAVCVWGGERVIECVCVCVSECVFCKHIESIRVIQWVSTSEWASEWVSVCVCTTDISQLHKGGNPLQRSSTAPRRLSSKIQV